jgi:DNA-binding MarR family transcriptional regulator
MRRFVRNKTQKKRADASVSRLESSRKKRADGSAGNLLPRMDDIVANKILILANLVGRSATLRYRRLLGLPHVSWRLIALLGGRSPMTLHELAATAGLDKSQVSNRVSDLVRQQLVSRRISPDDRRAIKLELTERGVGTYAILINSARRRNEVLLAGVSRRRRRALLKLLDLLMDRARYLLADEERRTRT